MHSWPAPEVPALPGEGHPLHLYDTAAGEVRLVRPGPTASMYVCGITPYDATHMGHAATYNAFDLVQRVWRDAGHQVTYVQNVTDVDDPLLERAQATGMAWEDLAEQETTLFREDMAALRMLAPDHFVGAVESIPDLVPIVRHLLDTGAAYELDGDVYFSVDSDAHFGEVSHLGAQEMRELSAERGGDPERPGKKNPLDPQLWVAARPGEPSWETALGSGRPGWHIECVAIALRYLGMGFDVQGGGSDLVFPHHEMGASHAQVHTGQHPFAETYVHAGMVGLDGEKMSKSKGNLVLVSQLRQDGVEPAAVRLALLANHYRDDWMWTRETLTQAERRLARWRASVSRPDGTPAEQTLTRMRAALANDLDSASALTAVDEWVGEQERNVERDVDVEAGAPGVVARAADALLGVAL